MEYTFDGSLLNGCFCVDLKSKIVGTTGHSFNIGPYGKVKKIFFLKYQKQKEFSTYHQIVYFNIFLVLWLVGLVLLLVYCRWDWYCYWHIVRGIGIVIGVLLVGLVLLLVYCWQDWYCYWCIVGRIGIVIGVLLVGLVL